MDDFHTRGISDVEVFPVGKKILAELSRTKGAHPSELPVPWDAADVYASSRRLADALMEDFRAGRYDRVEVLYTSYKSMGSQTVRLRCLLPFMPDPETSGLPGSGNDPSSEPVSLPHPEAAPGRPADYILEPGAEEVAATLYPMSIRAALFEMCLSGNLRGGVPHPCHAGGERQRPGTHRHSPIGVQQTPPTEHHRRIVRYFFPAPVTFSLPARKTP